MRSYALAAGLSWVERKFLRPQKIVETMVKEAMKNFERITVDPAQMGGVPCIRHLRIPVATVLRLLAGGLSESDILSQYPDLQQEDIRECLRFAAASAMERELPLPA